MERNLRLYLVYEVTQNLFFWFPVFFLYLLSAVPAKQALLLEAVYYLGVVAFEVPSGYFSDRLGRRLTLLISMASATAGCLVFAVSHSFLPFLAAQLLLAVSMAFRSGSDSALLYDSLAALGRAEEFVHFEGRARSYGFLALGGSALIGGALAGFDLRIAYVLTAVATSVGFLIAWQFTEPLVATKHAYTPGRQLIATVGRLGDRTLLWLFAFSSAMTVFIHVPYEFLQPYLKFLFELPAAEFAVTPLVSGVVVALAMLLSAWASRQAVRARDQFGVVGTLLASLLLEGIIIVGMALLLHPIVISLMLLRSIPDALSRPIIHGVIHARLSTNIRATYLSMQSLAGRLAFSGSLAIASWVIAGLEGLTPETMATVLLGYAAMLLLVFVVLSITRSAVTGKKP
ncbi:MAG: MFS transporter [Gammaproteobacteria bacterium]|nr:MFS transporter [Gammaproteobacteria bacterium]